VKLGVFLPNWIGDVTMAGPTLRALRQHFGCQATLIGILRPYVADVLAGTGWLDEQWFYDPKSREPLLRGWALVRRMRRRKLDLAVLLTNSFRTAALAYLGGARQRIGYVRYARGPLLTHGLPVEMAAQSSRHTPCAVRFGPFRGRASEALADVADGTRSVPPARFGSKQVPCPTVDYYLKLAYAAGCPPQSPRLELAITAEDEQAASLVWKRLGLGPHVVVFNSSGAYGAAKLWPPEYFADLARRVADQLDHHVLVLCGPGERQIAAEIVRRAEHRRVVSLAEEPLGIGLSKACIRRGRLLVTTDSGPRHFAIAFNVPVVGLYGPTPPIWGANPTAREICLHQELDCFGCHRRACPLGHHRCMRDLSVDRVFRAVVSQLHQPQRSAA
jgi:heptosyltransferase-2